jgi:DNA (cytosine-5)-methyltransferase 1
MRFIELFAGIGGFRLGLEQAGHKCVYTNEWLKKPASIYEKQFGDKPDTRDIISIRGNELPEADLICGGFPCATFSVAGKRQGFSLEDTRGTLCFEMFRLAKERKVPYILFENVKGLLNHDKGRTLRIMLAALDELGYDTQWEVLDSQNFGVPQHRERIFVIGHLRGTSRPQVFPIGRPSTEDDESNKREQKTRQGLFSNISPTLDAHYSKGGASRQYVTQWRRGYFRDYKSDGSPTLTANMGTGGHNVPFIKKRVKFVGALGKPRKNSKEKDKHLSRAYSQSKRVFSANGVSPTLSGTERSGRYNVSVKAVITPDRKNKKQNGRRMKEDGEPSFTLGAQDRHGVALGTQIRKLTPLECERLQGLPDNFTKYYADGSLVSNSERYERCGRTVTIPVIKAIGDKLNGKL